MAIEYYLQIGTQLTAKQAARELRDAAQTLGLFDESVTVEKIIDDGTKTRLGTWVKVRSTEPPPWDVIVTDLGFNPTVSVTFRLYKHDKIPEQQNDMTGLVARLLERVSGDAVLTDFDSIWLLRRGGELSVSEDDNIWPPERLAALTQPYRRATHTFSEE